MFTNSVVQKIRWQHSGDVLDLLSNIWGLRWEHSNGLGLKSSGSFFAHMSGAWLG